MPQAVDRHDARMLQAAGDFGLLHEPRTAGGMVGMFGLDFLDCDGSRPSSASSASMTCPRPPSACRSRTEISLRPRLLAAAPERSPEAKSAG